MTGQREVFKPKRQLAATVVYFMRKNFFKEVNVESISDEFKLKKEQLYKLVSGKKFKSGKVTKLGIKNQYKKCGSSVHVF